MEGIREPQEGSSRLKLNAEYILDHIKLFFEQRLHVRPLLLTYGYFPETIDRWIAAVNDELQNLRKRVYIKVSRFGPVGLWLWRSGRFG